jgi:predicted dithiol-disulfide oxidoreductase (DUF899 family)
MTSHRVGTQEEWQRERDALLAEEKELTRRGDELTRKTPGASLGSGGEELHTFATERGTETLADLFDGRSQLVVYHFMFGRHTRPDARSAPRSPTRSRNRCLT